MKPKIKPETLPIEKYKEFLEILEGTRQMLSRINQEGLRIESEELYYKQTLQVSGILDTAISNLQKKIQNIKLQEE